MRYTRFLAIGLLAAAAACDRGSDSAAQGQVDPSQLTSAGEVSLTDGGTMSFNITSERYKQWDQARREFPKSLITRFGQVLQPRSPSERSITNAVALLEGNAQARAAIERAGLNVRGFVEITVALEQQMMVATRGPEPVRTVPLDNTYPLSMDSGYYPAPAYTPPPVTPLPQPYPAQTYTPQPYTPQPYTPVLPPSRDTVRRDTLLPAPTPTPTPIPTPRPDTMPTRRDTAPAPVRRDTVIAPSPPRDTIRDPSPVAAPPHSVRGA
jgi:hypothetical protein